MCPDTEVVIVHDAVRPSVDEDTIVTVSQAALKHGVRNKHLSRNCNYFDSKFQYEFDL